jgi:glutamate:GABA antiporter
MRRALGLADLVLWNIVTVAGLRWLAVAAHTGPGSVVLWISAGLLFFVPSALVVAGLARRYPEEGGLYVWTRELFGPWHGFLCGSCYFLSTLFFLPTILLSGLAMAAVAFDFNQNKWVMVGISLGILWLVLAANLVGLGVGKWTSNLGGIATILVGTLLIAAGAFVWLRGGPFNGRPLTMASFLPRWDWEKLNFWSQIALAFTGLELGAIMAGEIRDPERTIPRAAWISGAAISAFYIGGTLAILALVSAERVDIMAGPVQAGQSAGARLGWTGFPALIAILVLAGAAGNFGSWLSGCARLPFVIGIDRYLPPAFARLHPRWGTPYLALVGEAAVCTLFLVVMTLGETLRAGYQILVDLTTVTTLLPFLYIFAAGWKCRYHIAAACGLAVSALAIVLAFIPPEGASLWYETKLVGGCAAVVAASRLNFNYATSRRHAAPTVKIL